MSYWKVNSGGLKEKIRLLKNIFKFEIKNVNDKQNNYVNKIVHV